MKKKTKIAKRSAKSKPKAKTKASKTLKVKAKTKRSPKRAKKASAPTLRAAAKKKSKGLSIVELFQMKTQSEQSANQSGDEWKHKKDLPPQDQHSKDDMRVKNNAAGKKSGFGGARHH